MSGIHLLTSLEKHGVVLHDADRRRITPQAVESQLDTNADLYVKESAGAEFVPLKGRHDLKALGALYGEKESSDSVIRAMRNLDVHGARFFQEPQNQGSSHEGRALIGPYAMWKKLPSRHDVWLGLLQDGPPAYMPLSGQSVTEYFMTPQDVLTVSCFRYGGDPSVLADPMLAANVQELAGNGFFFTEKFGIGLMPQSVWSELQGKTTNDDVLVGAKGTTLCWLTPERARQPQIIQTLQALSAASESHLAERKLPRVDNLWLGEAVMRADKQDEPVDLRMQALSKLLDAEQPFKTERLSAAGFAAMDFLELQKMPGSSAEVVDSFVALAGKMGRQDALGMCKVLTERPISGVSRDEAIAVLCELHSDFRADRLQEAYSYVTDAATREGKLPYPTLRESMAHALIHGQGSAPSNTHTGSVQRNDNEIVIGNLRVPRRPSELVWVEDLALQPHVGLHETLQ